MGFSKDVWHVESLPKVSFDMNLSITRTSVKTTMLKLSRTFFLYNNNNAKKLKDWKKSIILRKLFFFNLK